MLGIGLLQDFLTLKPRINVIWKSVDYLLLSLYSPSDMLSYKGGSNLPHFS